MFFLLFYFIACAYAQDSLSVRTDQGVIVGKRATDGNYYTFYGIYYGGNTADENRFKDPTPPPRYEEYHATNNKIVCAHPTPNGIEGTEDCLVLNIFTQNTANISRPVLVYIENDEYARTSQNLVSPRKLVEENLVLVTISHRLSIFGFLCLGVPEAPGNVGIKDVIQGLRWIKQNIGSFGGDPNNIVLIGHGSGAAMAEIISLSPLAKDLVNKVIAVSGSALSPWAVAYEPVKYARSVGEKLEYVGKSNDNLAKRFVKTSTRILAPALNDFEFYNNTPLFAPCIESPSIPANQRVLPDSPINILRSRNYNRDIPYIAVFVDNEGTSRAQQAMHRHWLTLMNNKFDDFLQPDLKFDTKQNKSAVAEHIKQFYFRESAINLANIDDYLDYYGDTLVVISVLRGLSQRAETSNAPVRLLEFAYKKKQDSDWLYPEIRITGARHGLLLDFLFDNGIAANDRNVQDTLLRRFAAFARTGDPNPSDARVNWNAYTISNRMSLHISGDGSLTPPYNFQEELRTNIREERVGFWNVTLDKYYISPMASAGNVASVTLVLVLCQIIFISLSVYV